MKEAKKKHDKKRLVAGASERVLVVEKKYFVDDLAPDVSPNLNRRKQ